MIEINLLPSGAARRPVSARRPLAPGGGGSGLPSLGADPRAAAMAGAAVLLLLLGAFWFWRSGQRQGSVQAEIEREQQDSVRLERTIALMRALDTRRDTISRKMEVIRRVDGRRYVWPHLLDEVSRAVPPFMWLTRVAVAEEEATLPAPAAAATPADTSKADSAAAETAAALPEGPSFSIEGNAGSTQALTRFMRALEASPMIRDVALVTSEQTEFQRRSVLKFTVEARWEEPDSSFVQTVPLLTVR